MTAGGQRQGPGGAVPVIAEVTPAVTSAIYAHAGEQLRREIAGVLVGVYQLTSAGYVVRITGTIRAQHTDAAHTHVTFTHETWDQLHAELERHHQGRTIVGWYHSHPGLGLFLSSMDRFICDNFFNLPWHLAMVVDPVAGNDVYFSWRGRELVRMPLVSSLQSGTDPSDRWSFLVSPAQDVDQKVEDSVLVLDLDEGVARPEVPVAAAAVVTAPPKPPPAPPPPPVAPAGAVSPRRWPRARRWQEWAIVAGVVIILAVAGTMAGLFVDNSSDRPVAFVPPTRDTLVESGKPVHLEVRAEKDKRIDEVMLSITPDNRLTPTTRVPLQKAGNGLYTYDWQTTRLAPGTYTLSCWAVDKTGKRVGNEAERRAYIGPPASTTTVQSVITPTTTLGASTTSTLGTTTTADGTAPDVHFEATDPLSPVQGDTIHVRISAKDHSGIARVNVWVVSSKDGKCIFGFAHKDPSGAYVYAWYTADWPTGTSYIYCNALDTAFNLSDLDGPHLIEVVPPPSAATSTVAPESATTPGNSETTSSS